EPRPASPPGPGRGPGACAGGPATSPATTGTAAAPKRSPSSCRSTWRRAELVTGALLWLALALVPPPAEALPFAAGERVTMKIRYAHVTRGPAPVRVEAAPAGRPPAPRFLDRAPPPPAVA